MGAGVIRLFFEDSFSCVYSPSFSKGRFENEIPAFVAESCVRLIGAVTETASRDGVRFENLMLATKDVTGQARPSPIPRFGDGNKSEEKECKLL